MTRRRVLVGAVTSTFLVGASATAVAQNDEGGDDQSDGEDGQADGETANQTDGEADGATEEVIVGPDGELVFEPAELTIEPGTTVSFTWDSDNHNVNPTEQPEDADWEGHIDIENAGFEYEHSFEVEGEYHYVCDPHVSQGMEGDVIVAADAGQGGDGGPVQTVPDSAWTLLIASAAGMIAVLSLTYAFVRFGGS